MSQQWKNLIDSTIISNPPFELNQPTDFDKYYVVSQSPEGLAEGWGKRYQTGMDNEIPGQNNDWCAGVG